MKKIYLPLFILTMVIIIVGIWIFQSGTEMELETNKLPEIIQVTIIVLLFIFGIYFSIGRIRNQKHGLPVEDEFSKKVKTKAAAMSYYVSLYWLLAITYFSDKYALETHTLFAIAILGMAIFWAGFWFYYNFKGNVNE